MCRYAREESVARVNFHQLESRIKNIPLFKSVGLPPPGAGNPRISQWDEWAGPEDPGCEAIALRQQDLHDALLPPEAEQDWLAALQLVVDHAATLIPYDPDEDAWHPPTTAAWGAAWTFALEQLCLSQEVSLPDDLKAQLEWYERGHWPCSLIDGSTGTNLEDYVIF